MSTGEVTAFLETIGLEHYASALINTGFYTSVDALSSATVCAAPSWGAANLTSDTR
mgnify:CR=1 FL=1